MRLKKRHLEVESTEKQELTALKNGANIIKEICGILERMPR